MGRSPRSPRSKVDQVTLAVCFLALGVVMVAVVLLVEGAFGGELTAQQFPFRSTRDRLSEAGWTAGVEGQVACRSGRAVVTVVQSWARRQVWTLYLGGSGRLVAIRYQAPEGSDLGKVDLLAFGTVSEGGEIAIVKEEAYDPTTHKKVCPWIDQVDS